MDDDGIAACCEICDRALCSFLPVVVNTPCGHVAHITCILKPSTEEEKVVNGVQNPCWEKTCRMERSELPLQFKRKPIVETNDKMSLEAEDTRDYRMLNLTTQDKLLLQDIQVLGDAYNEMSATHASTLRELNAEKTTLEKELKDMTLRRDIADKGKLQSIQKFEELQKEYENLKQKQKDNKVRLAKRKEIAVSAFDDTAEFDSRGNNPDLL